MLIVLASAIVWSCFLLLYAYREATRDVHHHLHGDVTGHIHVSLEDNQVARFPDVLRVIRELSGDVLSGITQIPSVRHPASPGPRHIAPFREDARLVFYVPPLPKDIIECLKVRTVSADPKSYSTPFGLEEGAARLRRSGVEGYTPLSKTQTVPV